MNHKSQPRCAGRRCAHFPQNPRQCHSFLTSFQRTRIQPRPVARPSIHSWTTLSGVVRQETTRRHKVTRSGKSPSSIRRIIYPILEEDQHADRAHIQPSPAEAKALCLKGESFAWKISEDLLRRAIPEGPSAPASQPKPAGADDQSAAIIEMLRKELDIKNQQIAMQTELLKGLSERLREGNILMGSLQQQLALAEGPSRSKNDTVDASEAADRADKGSEPPAPSPPKRLGLFGRLFG